MMDCPITFQEKKVDDENACSGEDFLWSAAEGRETILGSDMLEERIISK